MASAERARVDAQVVEVSKPTGPGVCRAIIGVMRDVDAIGKDRRNDAQRYSFRGIDDVYNELHGHLARHGLFTVPRVISERSEERTTKSGGAQIYRILTIAYTFYAEDGSSLEAVVVGEGMDTGDKASNKALAVAHKYALMQVFAIPTEDAKDPEQPPPDATRDDLELAPRQVPPTTKPSVVTYDGSPAQRRALQGELDKKYGLHDDGTLYACCKALRGTTFSVDAMQLATSRWVLANRTEKHPLYELAKAEAAKFGLIDDPTIIRMSRDLVGTQRDQVPSAVEAWIAEFAPEYDPRGGKR